MKTITNNIKNKKINIIGYGISGNGAAELALYLGADVGGVYLSANRPLSEFKSLALLVQSIRRSEGAPGLGFLRANFTSATFACSTLVSAA